MSATYERLPVDDESENPPSTPSKNKPKKSSRRPSVVALVALAGLLLLLTSAWRSLSKQTQTAGTEQSEKSGDMATEQLDEVKGGGKYSVGYFVNWGIYGRKFPPSLIPMNDLTHILYAFANINSEGEVILSDTWADTDIHYPGDSWNEPQGNLYGNFKAIYLLKKANRHVKLLLSIGGWTYSPNFHPVVVDAGKRKKFVESSVKLLEDLGLDGLDVDYEYPTNDAQAKGYVSLLQEMRKALDDHSKQKGIDYKFLLTVAAPCGSDNYKKLHIKEMDKQLDFWNMMAYDFAGSWDKVANHQANIYPTSTSLFSANAAIDDYIKAGVPASKLILGIPLYGRSFLQTTGPGTAFSGIGQGSWEQGVYDYRSLPRPHSQLNHDDKAKASWCYDPNKKEMVSFDDEQVGKWKGEWIKQKGLGGSMFWELSGDKGSKRDGMEAGEGKEDIPGASLVRVVKDAMGGLKTSEQNWLRYEGSKYPNMKSGMS